MEVPKTFEEYMALDGKKAILHDLDYIKSLPGVIERDGGDLTLYSWSYFIMSEMFPYFGKQVTLANPEDYLWERGSIFCEEMPFRGILFEWIKEVID